MRHYRIYCLDLSGRICFAHNVRCPDDEAALREGELQSEKSAVEVWEGGRLLARLSAKLKVA